MAQAIPRHTSEPILGTVISPKRFLDELHISSVAAGLLERAASYAVQETSEFEELHKRYKDERRAILARARQNKNNLDLTAVRVRADALGDSGYLSDSEEDNEDLVVVEPVRVRKRPKVVSHVMRKIGKEGASPSFGTLANLVTSVREDLKAQMPLLQRAISESATTLHRYRHIFSSEHSRGDDDHSIDDDENAQLMLLNHLTNEVGMKDAEVTDALVSFELVRLVQELRRTARLRLRLMNAASEVDVASMRLKEEWGKLMSSYSPVPTSSTSPRSPSPALRIDEVLTDSSSPCVISPRTAWKRRTPSALYLPQPTATDDSLPSRAHLQARPRTNNSFIGDNRQSTPSSLPERQGSRDSTVQLSEPKEEGSGCRQEPRESEYVTDVLQSKEKINAALLMLAQQLDAVANLVIEMKGSIEQVRAVSEHIRQILQSIINPREMIPVAHTDGCADEDDSDDDEEYVHTAEVVQQGWLVKQGDRRRNSKVRYFVLFEGGRLAYYISPKKVRKNQPKGFIDLSSKVRFFCWDKGNPPSDKSVARNLFVMELVTASRTYVLCCQSHADLEAWSFHFQSYCRYT